MVDVVVGVVEGEVEGRGPGVAVSVEVEFVDSVDHGDQDVHPDVELPAVEEERPFHVLLQDEGTQTAIAVTFLALETQVDVV